MIEAKLSEIQEIIEEKNIKINTDEIEYISIQSNVIKEEEFFKIVEVKNNKQSKSAGRFQESLYSHYLEAKKECDKGYLDDVMTIAVTFNKGLNYVKSLTKSERFMTKWRNNMGQESPISIFKHQGNLKLIHKII